MTVQGEVRLVAYVLRGKMLNYLPGRVGWPARHGYSNNKGRV